MVFLTEFSKTGDSKRTLQVMNLSTGKPVKVSKAFIDFAAETSNE